MNWHDYYKNGKNMRILNYLISKGLAHPNPYPAPDGNGTWGWTEKGYKIPSKERDSLGAMIYYNADNSNNWLDLQKKYDLPKDGLPAWVTYTSPWD